MRKPRLLLPALAAALLAGCIAAPPGSSVPPVSSPAPQATVTPEEALAQKLRVPVTCDDGLTLVAVIEEQELLDRLGSPEGSWFKPPVFVTDNRLLLPLLLPDGGSEWYLYEPKTDALTLLARLHEQCPTIPAAWMEGEKIRVVSDIGAFTLDPAGEPVELSGLDSDWTLRANPVTGEVYRCQGGQLIAAAPDGSESVRYTWPGKEVLSAVAVSPDGEKLFFGIIPYESINNVVVLDLATGAAEVTPIQAAYPWYCWLGDQPCLVTVDEAQGGLLLRYGEDLASSFLWQFPQPDGWRKAQVSGCADGQMLLIFSYPVGEEEWRDTLTLLGWDGAAVTERALLETDGLICGTALSQDAGRLAILLRDGVGLPPRLLLYAIDG